MFFAFHITEKKKTIMVKFLEQNIDIYICKYAYLQVYLGF